MDTTLEKVLSFATAAHGSQRRKYTPEPYIVHPKRVMETCRGYNTALPVLAAALLHDVLEDTGVGAAEMEDFLQSVMAAQDADRTLELVIELTDVFVKSDYPKLNRRRRKEKELDRLTAISPEAQTIKYADILDNCLEITTADPGFAPRFLHECRMILKHLDKGDAALRAKAIEVVDAGLEELA